MNCLICGDSRFKCIHKGTRDVSGINVVKCVDRGLVQLIYSYLSELNMKKITDYVTEK